jgi:hypothetical protein
LSAEIAAGITYKIPTLAAVKNYIGGLCYGNTAGGGTSITQYVASLNGLTGAVGLAGGTDISVAISGQTLTVNYTGSSVSNAVTSFNGLTGAVQGVSAAVAGTGISVSGATGAVTITNTGVVSFNGNTGAVQSVSAAVAGTGISVSGATGAVTITNTGVQSFNGVTGAVTGASLGANTFTGLQTLNAGLSASAVYVSTGSTFAGLVTFTNGVSAAGTITLASPNLTGTPTAPTAALGTNTTQIATTAFVQSEIVADTVTAFNGRTGAVQGVSAAVAGTGISVSGATGSVTITNTGVQSFNGNTGAVTGASLGANTFTALNSFNAGISSVGGTFSGDIVKFLSGLSASFVRVGSLESNNSNPVTLSDNRLRFTVVGFPTSSYTTLQADPTTSADRTVTLPDESGTVALTSQLMGAVNGSTAATTAVTSFNGLTGAVTGVTVGGANTFTALNTFNEGISAAGATFASNIIVNTMTVGRGNTSGAVSNTALGVSVLAVNSGTFNTGVGNSALTANTTGGSNTAVGRRALFVNTTGSSNTAIGQIALGAVTGGVFNTAIGSDSLSSTLVSNSTAVGAGAIQYNVSGNDNTAVGAFAGSFWGEGSTASILSNQLQTGAGGVYIGYYARGSTFNQTNEIVIGANAVGGGSNTAVIGATSQVSATVYGLFNAPSGVCASGATFSGQVRVNGNLFANNIVNALNGFTGGVTLAAGTGISVSGATGAVTITNIGVQSFNGLTGEVGGVCAAQANTFTALNSFNAGISSAGGTFSALTRFTAGISASGGMTLAGFLQGTTANFTGTVTGTTFIGGLSGNATGIIINASSSSSELFPVLCTSTSSTVARADTVAPRVSIIPSTGQLTAPVFRVASTASGGAFTEITDAGIITANSDLTLLCDANILSLGDVNYITNGCKIVIDNSSGLIDVNAVGSPLTLTGSSVSVSGLLNAPDGISSAGGTFSALTRFTAGISASGGVTFSGTVSSDTGYRITSSAINAQTGTTYTFLESDNGKVLTFNNGSAVTVTIPTALPVGFNCTAIQLGAGQVGFTAASGLTLQSYGSQYRLIGQHASATIIEYSANIVNLSGNLVV